MFSNNIEPRFSIHAKYLAWKPVCEMYDISKKVKGQLYFKNFPVFYIHHSIQVQGKVKALFYTYLS